MEAMLICLHMRDNTQSQTDLAARTQHAQCAGQFPEVVHLKHVQIWLRKMGTGKTGLLLHTWFFNSLSYTKNSFTDFTSWCMHSEATVMETYNSLEMYRVRNWMANALELTAKLRERSLLCHHLLHRLDLVSIWWYMYPFVLNLHL